MIYQSQNPKISFSPKQTLWSWLLESKPLSPDSNAPGFTDALIKEHISFQSLKDYATTLSSALVTNYNLRQNDTVVVFAKNSIWYPVATLAAIRVGAVACGISPEYTVDECYYSLKTSKAKVVFATVDNFEIASTAAKKAGISPENVLLLEGSRPGVTSIQQILKSLDTLVEAPVFQVADGKSNRDICAFLCFSSGTTGLPKAVMISHANIIAQCIQTADITLPNHNRVLAALPFHHISGIIHQLHLPIHLNANIFVLSKFTLDSLLKTASENKIRELIIVPPILIRLYSYKYAHRVGMLVGSTEVRIVDIDTGEDCEVGKAGEIWARGPQMAMGYLDNPEATESTFDKDGFLHTGDIGCFDHDGMLAITDRLKEIIKVKGIGVAPAELEGLLLGHPHVDDVAVCGVPDERAGERPKAFVVLKSSQVLSPVEAANEIFEYVRKEKTRHKWLKEIELVSTIPKSPAGRDAKLKITEILPPELVGDILSWFCSHCNDDIEDGDGANTKALLALTQTSKDFRSIAMPILFHSLGPHLPSTYFFRVLDCHPDLAHIVKHLCLPLSTSKNSSVMKDSVLLTRYADRLSLSYELMTATQSTIVDVEMCLAMALCSDIERLKIQISDYQIIGRTRHFELLYSLLDSSKHGEIFPKLRHLDIDKTRCIRFSLCDPEPILLLRGAPHLQTLVLRGPGGERHAHQNSDSGIQEFCAGVTNITELQILGLPFFTGNWQTRGLERILGAAQNLKTFKFVNDGYSRWHTQARSQISPAQLIEFLSTRTHQSLQHLSLNFDSKMVPSQRNLGQPDPITPQQIKQFTNLNTLEMDHSCYYSHVVRRNGEEIIFEQETYLVDFLPQTVQSLIIFFNRSVRYDILDDITYLGQQTVAGDFPSLKRVQVDAPIRYTMPGSNSWDDDWDNEQLAKLSSEMDVRREEFQKAFAGSGVDTQFRTWCIWEEGW
ncbi:4-coumarate ligase-like 7 [Fusarium sp. NRRL 25303]|nr:4-coumarate ligase-like 7 [Fusarium sp. NRRL 25303]